MIRNDDVFGTLASCGGGQSTKSPSAMRMMLSANISARVESSVANLSALRFSGVDSPHARVCTIAVNVWFGTPFFMIMYLAALKSVPEQLYEAAAIDGANWWQRIWYVTLPMMRNIIAITTLFSLIVTFANFDIVRILTAGGPIDRTHVFATWAFWIGIQGNDIPLGASVSLFMVPILAIAAIFILRDVNKRGNEA